MSLEITLLNDELLDDWLTANESTRGKLHSDRLIRFWQEMVDGKRMIITAWQDTVFMGHITLQMKSEYPPFRKAQVPEIVDVWVQPNARRKGIAQQLLNIVIEAATKQKAKAIGMGVGVTPEYGAAHLLYSKNGFAPDGTGLWVNGVQAGENDTITLDASVILMWVKFL